MAKDVMVNDQVVDQWKAELAALQESTRAEVTRARTLQRKLDAAGLVGKDVKLDAGTVDRWKADLAALDKQILEQKARERLLERKIDAARLLRGDDAPPTAPAA